MTGYIFAATVMALLALPLSVEFEVAVRGGLRARARLGLGGLGLARAEVRRVDGAPMLAVARVGGRERMRALGGGGTLPDGAGPALRALARHLMRDVHVGYLGVRAQLGAGDAAISALLCGVVRAVLAGACAALGVQPELEVQPDFERAQLSVEAQGRLSAQLGHVIGAALAGLAAYLKGESGKWRARLALTRFRA